MNTTIQAFLDDYNGGATADVLTANLRECVSRVLANKKPGELSLTLKIKQLKGSDTQVEIEAITKHKMPTVKGDKAETAADTSVMHADGKGNLSYIAPKEYSLPHMA